MRELAKHKAAAALVVTAVLAVALGGALPSSNWHNAVLGVYAALFHACVPSFWAVLAQAAVNASDVLSGHLEEDMAHAARDAARGVPAAAAAARVREYRELWLELRSLADRASSAWGLSTLHYLLCCISAVLVNGFGLLSEAVRVRLATM